MIPSLLAALTAARRPTVLLLLLLALGGTAAAQTQPAAPDSSRISYEEETMPAPLGPPVGSEPTSLSRLTRLQVEEQELWKLGLNNFGVDEYESRFGVHLGYERKLSTAWSVLGELSPDIFRYQHDSADVNTHTAVGARVQVGSRYYYNLNQRIRKGKSASNFSANYLGLGLGAGLGRYSKLSPFYNYGRRGQPVRAVAMVQYGLQRRLGRYGFVDFNVGIPFLLTPDPSTDDDLLHLRLRLNLRIGLALGR